MSPAVRGLILSLATVVGPTLPAAAGVPPATISSAQDTPADCRQWQECRRLAIDAEERGDFSRFHDLAWRTVQTGPRNDHDLMFLLARAQARSGRPHDALVMLQRLAGLGAKVDASSGAFAQTRELPGWPEVEALITGGSLTVPAAGGATTAAAAAASPPPPPPGTARQPETAASSRNQAIVSGAGSPALSPNLVAPAAGAPGRPANAPARSGAAPAASPPLAVGRRPTARSEAAHFAAPRFAVSGIAYDAVSQRFVIGDALTKKLMVVGVGSSESTDMVRADSAGFEDVAAVEIDERRGDLWVAGAAGAVHRLQLVSGRPLKTYRPSPQSGPVSLVDLAVAASGTLFGLDAGGRRLLALGRGAEAWEISAAVDLDEPSSLALRDEGTAFVAHATGLARVDLRAHTTRPVAAAEGIDLSGIARLRSFQGGLLALQRLSGGSWRVLRLGLDGSGRRVATVTVLDDIGGESGAALDKPPFIAIAGDELYYVTTASSGAGATGTYVVRRLLLR